MKNYFLGTLMFLLAYNIGFSQKRQITKQFVGQKIMDASIIDNYSQQLSQHFTSFEIFNLNAQTLFSFANLKVGEFEFQMQLSDGKSWDFTIEKFDVRSEDYKFITLGPNGREEQPKSPTITYKGYVNGDPTNVLRMSITDNFISVLFTEGNHLYNIEPVTDYIQGATIEHYLFFENSQIQSKDFKCGTVTEIDKETNDRVLALQKSGFRTSAAACALADVALAANSQLVNSKGNGTKAGAEAYLTSFFNKSELYYANLQIKHRLAGIVVSLSSKTDMAPSTDIPTLRNSFSDWAVNKNGFAGIPHDIGTLITANISNGIIGQGNFQGLCSTNKFWHYNFADVVVGAQNLAHELAHLWSAPHDNSTLNGTYDTPNSCPANNCVMLGSNGHLGPVGTWSAKTLDL